MTLTYTRRKNRRRHFESALHQLEPAPFLVHLEERTRCRLIGGRVRSGLVASFLDGLSVAQKEINPK